MQAHCSYFSRLQIIWISMGILLHEVISTSNYHNKNHKAASDSSSNVHERLWTGAPNETSKHLKHGTSNTTNIPQSSFPVPKTQDQCNDRRSHYVKLYYDYMTQSNLAYNEVKRARPVYWSPVPSTEASFRVLKPREAEEHGGGNGGDFKWWLASLGIPRP